MKYLLAEVVSFGPIAFLILMNSKWLLKVIVYSIILQYVIPGRKLIPIWLLQGEANNVPFLEEEWCLRRSERIFLNEPSLHSPSLPEGTEKGGVSFPSKNSTDVSAAVTTTITTTSVITPIATPKPCKTSSSGEASPLKSKSSSKVKGKLKTVHDLSQKVKKKYSKPSKPLKSGLLKASATIKSVSFRNDIDFYVH